MDVIYCLAVPFIASLASEITEKLWITFAPFWDFIQRRMAGGYNVSGKLSVPYSMIKHI